MKKIILSLCVVVVLLWGSSLVFGQGKGKDKGKDRKVRDRSKVKDRSKVRDRGKGKGKDKRLEREVLRGRRNVKDKNKAKSDQRVVAGRTKKDLKGKGVEHKQQLKAIKKQIVHEEAKHVKRKVRLERIRELAFESGDSKAVERVDKLLGKEHKRFGRKQQRMQERRQTVLCLGKRDLSTPLKAADKGPKVKRGGIKKDKVQKPGSDDGQD